MTKVKAPLFSFEARGAIAESLVFFPWKGVSAVRRYVIPANPKTDPQMTQRGYMQDAVDKIHAVQALAAHPLDASDIVAYSQLGLTYPDPHTWFNVIVKLWLLTKVDGKVPIIYSDNSMLDTSKDDFRPLLYLNQEVANQLAAGKFYLGTSRTALITQKAGVIVAGAEVRLNAAGGFSGLTAGVKYFWQFRPDPGDPCEGADSGICTAVAT